MVSQMTFQMTFKRFKTMPVTANNIDDFQGRPVRSRYGSCAVISGICGLLCFCSFAIYAAGPPTVEDIEFNSVADGRLFTPRYEIQNQSEIVEIAGSGKIAIRALLDAEEIGDPQYGTGDPDNFDRPTPSHPPQGLRIKRLSTAWETGSGTLTVGDDWTNFQDFLSPAGGDSGYSSALGEKQTAEQITWASRDGFSIALEQPDDDQPDAVNDNIESLQALTDQSPNLILSWQGDFADQAGQYKVSALGRKLDLKGEHNGVSVDQSELGWGVNLAGGWHFGDLFAAIGVTLGNGIDSLILKRFGGDVAVSPSGHAETVESISILPSLSYTINKHSDFQVSLGRYKSADSETTSGIDTLDSINLGYTWSPWPSAQIRVEVVGKDFDGTISGEDSTEIKFGAQKDF